jgi:uncharacterized protein (DUF302 family)
MPELSALASSSTTHHMTRLDFLVEEDFDEFRTRFEQAVPPLDSAKMTELAKADASWDEMRAEVARHAPHEFMIYARIDGTPLMRLAGHQVPCIEYLMGNHVIAERMYRHDPTTLLYAPLRVVLYQRGAGRTVLAIDQPSTVFGGLDNPAITEVGHELDDKLAALLHHLGVGKPEQGLVP